LENIIYGRPTFSFNSSVSLFSLPENIEILEQNDAKRIYAEDAISYLLDSTYKVNAP